MNEPLIPSSDETIPVLRAERRIGLVSEPAVFDERGGIALIRAGLLIAVAVVGVGLGWAAMVPMQDVAIASGEVVPIGPAVPVSHRDGGVVGEILVAEGQAVSKGEVVLRLDAAPLRLEHEQRLDRLTSLLLTAERLGAVVEDRPPEFDRVVPQRPDLVAVQQRLWAGEIEAQTAALEAIDTEIDQRNREIAALQEALSIAQRQLDLITEQTVIRKNAMESGLVSQQVYLETALAKVKGEAEIARLNDQISIATAGSQNARNRRLTMGAEGKREAEAELDALAAEIAEVRAALTRIEGRLADLDLHAPAGGLVHDLRAHAAGEVVAPGAAVMTLVAANDHLQAELRIATNDIARVKVGQPVKLKVASYDRARYGTLSGRLEVVAATVTLHPSEKQQFFKGIVRLDRAYMGTVPGQYPVVPGMAVEAGIVTGQQSLAEYLLNTRDASSWFHDFWR